MRVLLDTHTLLWALTEPEKLSEQARDLMLSSENELFVSAVSAVEVSIKTRLGRLPTMKMPVAAFFAVGLPRLGAIELPFLAVHGADVERLPRHHKDPFDWMIMAQSRVESLPLLTNDKDIRRYEVETLW